MLMRRRHRFLLGCTDYRVILTDWAFSRVEKHRVAVKKLHAIFHPTHSKEFGTVPTVMLRNKICTI